MEGPTPRGAESERQGVNRGGSLPPLPRRRAAAGAAYAAHHGPKVQGRPRWVAGRGRGNASSESVNSTASSTAAKSEAKRALSLPPRVAGPSLAPEEQKEPLPAWRYVIQFGNNSGLLRQLMRSRRLHWAPAPGDPGHSAGNASYQERRVKVKATPGPEINLLWTQYRSLAFLNAMALQLQGLRVELNEEKTIKLKASKAKGGGEMTGLRCHNHFEGGGAICTKKGLCETMSTLFLNQGRDPFGALPLTFIVESSSDPQFALFEEAYQNMASVKQRIWIVKPAEWANRGCGIRIYKSIEEVRARVDSKERAWAVQKYIEKPLLIHHRKFDIRAYCLVMATHEGQGLRALGFRDAYLRTSSSAYTTKSLDRMVHLNNDAVQKQGEEYGKFESGNKLSLEEFQKFLDEHQARKINVREDIMPKCHGLMADAIRSAAAKLNPRKIGNCFEVFGFDFMVDSDFRVWLIECNANPCLDLCSAYLAHLIPNMLDQALRLTVDSFIDGQECNPEETKWDLLYDSEAADSLSSTWVEELPAGFTLPMLGTQILGRKSKKGHGTLWLG